MPKTFIIDSISSEIARLESADSSFVEIPYYRLPPSSKEGDVLTLITGDHPTDPGARFAIDTGATEQRRKTIRSKLDRLRKRGSR